MVRLEQTHMTKKPFKATLQEPCLELRNYKGTNYRKLYFAVQVISLEKPLHSSLFLCAYPP